MKLYWHKAMTTFTLGKVAMIITYRLVSILIFSALIMKTISDLIKCKRNALKLHDASYRKVTVKFEELFQHGKFIVYGLWQACALQNKTSTPKYCNCGWCYICIFFNKKGFSELSAYNHIWQIIMHYVRFICYPFTILFKLTALLL